MDAEIARVARSQHGVITLAQLQQLGLARKEVEYRLRVGRLHRIHRGVYAVGHTALSPEALFLSAVLATSPNSLLSHLAAAHLWRLRTWKRQPVVVLVAGRDIRSRPTIRVHQTQHFYEDDIAHRDGIWVTSPARTILDLASVLEEDHLKRTLAQAEIHGRLTREQLSRQLERHPRAPGRGTLARILDAGRTRARSELEATVADLTGATRVNRIVAGYEVDLHFPDRNLIVEVDSHRFHAASPTQLLLDAEKDAHLRARGHEIQRVRQTDPAATCR